MPALEDNDYFEKQIEKSIKVETSNVTKAPKNIPKSQVVLPKL